MVLRKTREAARKAQSRTLEATREREEGRIVQDAARVVSALARALDALREDRVEEAREYLEQAREHLQGLRERYEEIQALPVAVQVYDAVYVQEPDAARALLEQARQALEEGRVPLARVLLNQLRNEIVVLTELVPLDVMIRTLELAETFLLHDNRAGAVQALGLLDAARNRVQTIIPRPLLEARYIIDEIRNLETRENQDVILELLDLVRKKVELARVLGYVLDQQTLDDLTRQIEEIEQGIRREEAQEQQLQALQQALDRAREQEEQPSAQVETPETAA